MPTLLFPCSVLGARPSATLLAPTELSEEVSHDTEHEAYVPPGSALPPTRTSVVQCFGRFAEGYLIYTKLLFFAIRLD